MLSLFYLIDDDQGIDSDDGIFMNNTNIESVFLGNNVKFISNNGGEVIENTISYLFYNCTNLINVLKIPSSATNMYGTFRNCTNLTGIVKINSSNVSNATYIFTNTTKSITVQVVVLHIQK